MSRGPITVWLEKWRAGDPEALDQLLPLVYREVARHQRQRTWSAAAAWLRKELGPPGGEGP